MDSEVINHSRNKNAIELAINAATERGLQHGSQRRAVVLLYHASDFSCSSDIPFAEQHALPIQQDSDSVGKLPAMWASTQACSSSIP